jgi:predicted NAD/FAD-dependent oxidoreductase
MTESFRVVVVGAGLSGLTCASFLRNVVSKKELVLLDKGNHVGGRLLTQRFADEGTFDVGAQFFTVRSKEFEEAANSFQKHVWCDGFNAVDGHPRFACQNGMRAIAVELFLTVCFLQKIMITKRTKSVTVCRLKSVQRQSFGTCDPQDKESSHWSWGA